MFSAALAQLPDFGQLESALGSSYRFGGSASLGRLFNWGLINIIFFVAGAAFLFFVISSGLSMMTSKGDPKALEGAKARLTQAVTGFAIIFAAYWIVQIVGLLLGVPGFNGTFLTGN